MIGNFENTKPNLNLPDGVINYADYSAITNIFFTDPVFVFNNLTELQTKSYWINAIANEFMFPVHDIKESDRQSEEIGIVESRNNRRVKTKDGKDRFVLSLNCDIEYYQRLRQYAAQNLDIYFADINGNIYSKLDTTYKPFEVELIEVGKLIFGSGGSPSYTTIIIDFHDNLDLAYVFKPTTWFAGELKNIEVYFSDFAQAVSGTLTFTIEDEFGTGIEGLELSDFSVVDNIRGSMTLSTLNDLGDGDYSLVATASYYNGIITLVDTDYHGIDEYSIFVPTFSPLSFSSNFSIS